MSKLPELRGMTGAEAFELLMEEFNRLKRGTELLENVHLAIGAYGTGKVSDTLRFKINDFFGFDDSE